MNAIDQTSAPEPSTLNSTLAPNSAFSEDVAPWPEPVNGASLLTNLASLLTSFLILPKWSAETLALWILHTYAFKLRDVSTYIGIESPEKRCGKTTLLTVLSELVHCPVISSNISSPAFFRVIEEMQPTLLIDEADTFLHGNHELRGILNSGYKKKTAFVVRVTHEAPRSAEVGSPRSSDGRGDRGEGSSFSGVQSSELKPSASGLSTINSQLSTNSNPPE